MATSPRTPVTTERPSSGSTLAEFAADPPASVTASRAVRPPVVVPNRRLGSKGYGEAFLTWRCLDCGELGALDALPTRCVCGADRELLYYETED